jgi:hypothetical protein
MRITITLPGGGLRDQVQRMLGIDNPILVDPILVTRRGRMLTHSLTHLLTSQELIIPIDASRPQKSMPKSNRPLWTV